VGAGVIEHDEMASALAAVRTGARHAIVTRSLVVPMAPRAARSKLGQLVRFRTRSATKSV
jgi:uncharacterized membrane protein